MSESDWQRVTIEGVDDINRRCNIYTSWLYDTDKRLKAKQDRLNTASILTLGLLRNYEAGVQTITAVGLALGFFDSQFSITRARTILDLGHDAISRVVEAQQKRYLINSKIRLVDQGRVKIFLRDYLEICTPAKIQQTLTKGGVASVENPASGLGTAQLAQLTNPAITAYANIPSSPTVPGQRPPPLPPKLTISNPLSEFEKSLLKKDAEKIQRGLCLPSSEVTGEFGDINSKTRRAIEQYKLAAHHNNSLLDVKDRRTLIENPEYVGITTNKKLCGGALKSKNSFEKFFYDGPSNVENMQLKLQRVLSSKNLGSDIINNSSFISGSIDKNTRDAIVIFQKHFQLPETREIDYNTANKLDVEDTKLP